MPNRHHKHPEGIRNCRDLFEVVAALLTPQVCSCELATQLTIFWATFYFARKESKDI
jgi:hypothetical protein